MKNKSFKLELPDFFRQRVHYKDSSGNMPKLVKPESERSGAESVIEDLLRWADDGGQMSDTGYPQFLSSSDTAEKRAKE